MSDPIKTDICVIGAGPGGPGVAAGAVRMGAGVLAISEGLKTGGIVNPIVPYPHLEGGIETRRRLVLHRPPVQRANAQGRRRAAVVAVAPP